MNAEQGVALLVGFALAVLALGLSSVVLAHRRDREARAMWAARASRRTALRAVSRLPPVWDLRETNTGLADELAAYAEFTAREVKG